LLLDLHMDCKTGKSRKGCGDFIIKIYWLEKKKRAGLLCFALLCFALVRHRRKINPQMGFPSVDNAGPQICPLARYGAVCLCSAMTHQCLIRGFFRLTVARLWPDEGRLFLEDSRCRCFVRGLRLSWVKGIGGDGLAHCGRHSGA